MWIRCNPNPGHQYVDDCVVRAIAIATNRTWLEVYDDVCAEGRIMFNMPSVNEVWGRYLYELGFEPFLLPESCPKCTTVKNFAKIFKKGTYIIGTGSHAVAVIDGDYYDAWDCGDVVPFYHRDESGIFRLASPRLINGWTRNRCCCCNKMPRARYIVNFGGNIQVPTGGTVEAISMAIAIDGEIDPSSIMTFTPAAVEQLGNISTQVIVEVPAICMCASVSVRNVSAQDIQLQNANMTIVFDGVHQ